MSYFIIKNTINIDKKQLNNIHDVHFNDLKKYMEFIRSSYKIEKKENDVNEIIEICSQLHIKKTFFCDFKINDDIKNFFTVSNNNYDTILSDKINENLNSKYNLILRIDDILNTKMVEYIYNLLQMYNEIVVYNCFATNLDSFRIYIVCLENKLNINYQKNKIPYSFLLVLKNLYYQIIQNRFNNIKKNINHEKNTILWNNMYLN